MRGTSLSLAYGLYSASCARWHADTNESSTAAANNAKARITLILFLTESLQNFIGMRRHVHLVEDTRDLAVFVDQKRLAVRAHVFFTIHALFAPNAVCLNDLFVGIGQQVERKLEFCDEFLLRFFA